MKTVGTKMVLESVDSTERSASGLVTLVGNSQNKAKVLAVGDKVTGPKVGDMVIWSGPAAHISTGGKSVVVVDELSVLVILDS